VTRFSALASVVLISGSIAGLLLFGVRHFTVVPLIEKAERFEEEDHEHAVSRAERTLLTAVTTLLTAIGLGAILFGSLALFHIYPNARQGILWGLAAFLCFHLAPALGLPPTPPGVPLAELSHRQLWWGCTVAAAAIGLWLMLGPRRTWIKLVAGAVCLAVPHLIGAPVNPGPGSVPADLIFQFAVASLAANAVFWVLLGALGGLVNGRQNRECGPSRVPTPASTWRS
jgi:cobalt transporter subunit CbtA